MIKIDPEIDTFLLDHAVDGTPLLPTVMQLDLVAREMLARTAAMPDGGPTAIRLRGIHVGPPLWFGRPGRRQLELECVVAGPESSAPAALHCQLRSRRQDAPHLVAVAEPADESAWRAPAPVPDGGAAELPCGPDLVYPPFFHGPAFRVVGSFGRAGAGMAATLAPGLRPLCWGSQPTVLRPQLLELMMQCCGIQELAETGAMMVPAAIDAVHWHPGSLATVDEAADSELKATALVVPRPGPPGRDRIFDGHVRTPDGTPLLTVTGYQTTDLGHPPNAAHSGRLTHCLAVHPR
jgi:Polyketide synthase dehydratase